jgi:hypothetical protein
MCRGIHTKSFDIGSVGRDAQRGALMVCKTRALKRPY